MKKRLKAFETKVAQGCWGADEKAKLDKRAHGEFVGHSATPSDPSLAQMC